MRFPDEFKFSAEDAERANLTPHHLHDPSEATERFKQPVIHGSAVPSDEAQAAKFKRLYVRQSDVEAFGYTSGCPRFESACDMVPDAHRFHTIRSAASASRSVYEARRKD